MKIRLLALLTVVTALVGTSYAVVHFKPAPPRTEPAATTMASGLPVDRYLELDRARASRSRTVVPKAVLGAVGSRPAHPKHHEAPAVQTRAATRTGGIARVWIRLVGCEAKGHWDYGKPGRYKDRGYNFEGGPNFLHSTWLAHGGRRFAYHAYDASPWQQIVIAKETLRTEGVDAWPVCGPRVGLTRADAYR